MSSNPVTDAMIEVLDTILNRDDDPRTFADEILDAIKDVPPWERLGAVGLTVVTTTKDGDIDFDVRDKRDWPKARS